jgi:fatty acid desaturase
MLYWLGLEDVFLFEWWLGLNRAWRFLTAAAVLAAAGLLGVLGVGWGWWAPLLVVGVILLVLSIEVKDG